MSDHARLFAFESDFVATLRCIPMAVRFKLDMVGVKLSLRHWSRLGAEQRRELLTQPCGDAAEIERYRDLLVAMLAAQTSGDVPGLPANETVLWRKNDRTPDDVRGFAEHVRVEPPSDDAWRSLSPLERFALLKLSRDNHDNVNFVPALQEFGLYRIASTSAANA